MLYGKNALPSESLRHTAVGGVQAGIRARNKDMRRWNATLESETHDMALMEDMVREVMGLK